MEEARRKRAIAKGQFTRAETKLQTAVTTQADICTVLTVQRRYAELKARWDTTQDAHDEYASLLTDEERDAEELWLTEIYDRFDKLEIEADNFIKENL